MSNLELFEKPEAEEINMIAGWRQWADAGETSSGLIDYLVSTFGARKIGHIKSDGLYLFQTPVSQFLFRHRVKFEDGYRTEMTGPRNDIYYWEKDKRGLVLFIGDEPHMNVERYAEAFVEIATTLKVKRVAATGGVYAMVPYDKERNFVCTYSLPGMKADMLDYMVDLSDYEGPVSIGSYLNDLAEHKGVAYFAWYGFVPMYDFSRMSGQQQNISIEQDYTAWLGIVRRLNHLFRLNLDLSDLQARSEELTEQLNNSVNELAQQNPNLPVREYLTKISNEFQERRFETPVDRLSDIWEDALGDIFKGDDNA
jgi:predicted ATP-grasp superfamily ATP-dependent carboligase